MSLKKEQERSVEEIAEELAEKLQPLFTDYITSDEVGITDIEDVIAITLQSERQKRDEVVEEALNLMVGQIQVDLLDYRDERLDENVRLSDIARSLVKYKTQPNNK